MVTDQTRNAIWQDLWDAERYSRYYSSLSDVYSRRHRLTRFATLASVLVEATISISFVSIGVEGVWATIFLAAIVVLGIVIGILAGWVVLANYGEYAAALSWVSVDCAALNLEWTDLWLDIESYVIDDEEARSRRRELLHKSNTIKTRIKVNLNQKLNEKLSKVSAEEAMKVLNEKYAY